MPGIDVEDSDDVRGRTPIIDVVLDEPNMTLIFLAPQVSQ
jgi:hypothetical protein